MAGPARGKVTVSSEECKGCGLCVESCPPKCLFLAVELSAYGVHPARYTGQDCTGCGICFYCCPEPGAITVYRLTARAGPQPPRNEAPKEALENLGTSGGGTEALPLLRGGAHAPAL